MAMLSDCRHQSASNKYGHWVEYHTARVAYRAEKHVRNGPNMMSKLPHFARAAAGPDPLTQQELALQIVGVVDKDLVRCGAVPYLGVRPGRTSTERGDWGRRVSSFPSTLGLGLPEPEMP